MKRAVDLVLSIAGLLLLSPLLLAVAMAVLICDGRPVLFAHARLGWRGHEFRMLKFRSMVNNAAAIGPYYTASEDKRITRLGRFLRRSSIDELPQLLNVLRGDMSVVGPRPDVPAQRSLYTDAQWKERCSVRPGITGLAQALLRSEATEEQRRQLDLRYAREHSAWLDAKIVWWTLARLGGKGAN
jgi:lipopolysaccharide/colanic/teichoic acid biosynthesis glycosyltransferase